MMKVILRSDVENLGELGDVVEVRAGYGRNYLLPQGHAMLATKSNLKVFERERKKLQEKVESMRAEASTLAEKIQKVSIEIPMRVGENDKLYGSVTTTMICDALEEQGIEVDRRTILLDTPIRTLGEFEVRVRVHAGIIADLDLKVVSDRPLLEEELERVVDPAVQDKEAALETWEEVTAEIQELEDESEEEQSAGSEKD